MEADRKRRGEGGGERSGSVEKGENERETEEGDRERKGEGEEEREEGIRRCLLFWKIPAAIISESAPQSASIVRTCFDPGDTERLTLSAIFFPLSIAATRSISRSEELVQDPMQT